MIIGGIVSALQRSALLPIKVTWDNEQKTILHVHVHGAWTWANMETAIQEVTSLLDTVEHKVDTIFDATGAGPIPPNAFAYLRKMNRSSHPNQDKVAVVGLTPLARTLMNTFSKVYGLAKGSDTRFMATLGEARAYLEQTRRDS